MQDVNPNISANTQKPLILADEMTKENLIIKQKKSDSKPFPVLLNELKRPLQAEAYEKDMSLHALCKSILRTHVESKQIGSNSDA